VIVLDASALLAFLFREKGHERVASILADACISAVNLSEVLGRFARDGHDPEEALKMLAGSPIEIVPFGVGDAALTASLVPMTRSLGLSLGDRACLALAMRRDATALTADRTWLDLDVAIEIDCIR
jgi:PIN domain nuclease of toxin-antitoxin system